MRIYGYIKNEYTLSKPEKKGRHTECPGYLE